MKSTKWAILTSHEMWMIFHLELPQGANTRATFTRSDVLKLADGPTPFLALIGMLWLISKDEPDESLEPLTNFENIPESQDGAFDDDARDTSETFNSPGGGSTEPPQGTRASCSHNQIMVCNQLF